MRIAHLADLHLGYRAYHRITPQGQNQREEDVAFAFQEVIAQLIELQPDLVLVAGDFFHTPRPTNAAIKLALRGLGAFRAECGAPWHIISGNHDLPRSEGSTCILRVLTEVSDVHVIERKMQSVLHGNVEIVCVPEWALSQKDRPSPAALGPADLHVLLLHGAVFGGSDRKLNSLAALDRSAIGLHELDPAAWTYLALGHYHKAGPICHNAYYTGGIERTTTDIWSETDQKGFITFDTDTFEADQPMPPSFHATRPRPVIDLPTIDARGWGAGTLFQQIGFNLNGKSIEGAIVRQVVGNVTREVARELPWKEFNEWRACALHFQLDLWPPTSRGSLIEPHDVPSLTLEAETEHFIRDVYVPKLPDIDREQLAGLALGYLPEEGE